MHFSLKIKLMRENGVRFCGRPEFLCAILEQSRICIREA